MAISGRNKICGVITRIELGEIVSKVVLSYSDGEITAIITTDSVQELRLQPGACVCALVKATDVMIVR
jgi:molybdate transport system regulatory protein